MPSFEPGKLRIQHTALQPNEVGYDIKLDYQVMSDPSRGKYVHFTLDGNVNGTAFTDEFELEGDEWYNFASNADHIARKHGLPTTGVLSLPMHKQYDAMFEDIRQQIGAKSGDPVAPEHLE
jgi:hypothetical protein